MRDWKKNVWINKISNKRGNIVRYIMVASTCTLLSPSSLYQKWNLPFLSWKNSLMMIYFVLKFISLRMLMAYCWWNFFIYFSVFFFSFVVRSTAPTLCLIFFFVTSTLPSLQLAFISFFSLFNVDILVGLVSFVSLLSLKLALIT